MANSPTQIFISYARKDGRDLALRLQADLTSKEYDRDAWLDTAEIAGGASWSNAIEAAIDRATVVLALLSAGSYQSEICRAEQLRSLRKGKRVIPLLVQPDAERPLYLEHLNYRDFSTADYPAALQTLLSDIDGGQTVPLPEEFRATFNNAPPLPRTFVSRLAEMERLRNAVVGDDAKRPAGTSQVALTALCGMGGSGKSLLAAALCQDEVVQAAFPDGIFWIAIGREARELVPRLAQIGERLGDDPARYTTPETAGDNLRNLLRDKAALFVLDDLWDAQHVTLFKANAPRCRILFTTRDGTIAKHHEAQEIQLGMLTPAQSRELLRASAGYDDPKLAMIAERLGHLPLALKLAGAQLQAGTTTTEWLETFHHVSQIKLGRRATDPHDNLQICFDLSVKQLAEDQDLYYALGIFAQDMAIPHQVMFRLWRQLAPTLTAADCRLLLTDLANLALVEAKDAETV
ncbi:MAG TPA: NB-ARC domain-containing protein, partial [Caldilineaceae bacterium]|nr:NB-ARC domain-containing protein [Caldilineaceae bacterium]